MRLSLKHISQFKNFPQNPWGEGVSALPKSQGGGVSGYTPLGHH